MLIGRPLNSGKRQGGATKRPAPALPEPHPLKAKKNISDGDTNKKPRARDGDTSKNTSKKRSDTTKKQNSVSLHVHLNLNIIQ